MGRETMGILESFKTWSEHQNYFIFSGCVEEKYPAIKEGLLTIGAILNHKFYTYEDQSCCSGPLTKMGLGNDYTLKEFTKGNLSLKEHNESIVITSCNGCYNYLIKSTHTETDISKILQEPFKKENVNEKKPLVLHVIEYISSWIDRISPLITYPLNNVKFAFHYGCHYINQYRLSNEVNFRKIYATFKGNVNWQYNSIPTYFKDIITPLGGTYSDYNELITCCGGSTPQRQIKIENSSSVALKKFTSLHNTEVDAILTMCPLCLYFLEESQFLPQLESKFKNKIPVIHVNELIGVALGVEKILDLLKGSHKISLDPILEKIVIK